MTPERTMPSWRAAASDTSLTRSACVGTRSLTRSTALFLIGQIRDFDARRTGRQCLVRHRHRVRVVSLTTGGATTGELETEFGPAMDSATDLSSSADRYGLSASHRHFHVAPISVASAGLQFFDFGRFLNAVIATPFGTVGKLCHPKISRGKRR